MKIQPQQTLALIIEDSDAGTNITIRQYLKELLKKLWNEGEGFSGKRPFGNSGWQYELYTPLIKAKFITGVFDENGYIEDCDTDLANTLILEAIEGL